MKFNTGNKVLDIVLYVVCCGLIIDSIMGIVLSIKKYRQAKADRKKAEAELDHLKKETMERFTNEVNELVARYDKLLDENADLRMKVLKYEIESKKGGEDDIITEGRNIINRTNRLINYFNETEPGEESEDVIMEIMNE